MQTTMTLNTTAPQTLSTPDLSTGSSVTTEVRDTSALQKSSAHAPQQPGSEVGHEALSPQEQQKILKESTEKFNKMSEKLNLDVKFAYNDKIDQVYLNVIDKHTGRVIRKLPSEEAMKISESMKELVGALLDKKG